MIDAPPIDHEALIEKFIYPASKLDHWVIAHTWGTPLLLEPGDTLRFTRPDSAAHDVSLSVLRDNAEYYADIPLFCVREQLCTTYDEVDLVFRFDLEGALLFDQDLEDGGAPSNGGKTGTGDIASV